MAQVISEIEARVDWLLQRLEIHWGDVEEASREWDDWEEGDRIDFAIEWPIAESHWEVLQDYLRDYTFTAAQLERYNALVSLMARLRPMVDRMLIDETKTSPA